MNSPTSTTASLHDAWVALQHGGNLLSPAALNGLPDPGESPWNLADRLRSALVAFDPNKPSFAALGDLLDVALEDACGLRDGWDKGNALGAADAEKLLDGTVLKPRRRWKGPTGEMLAVFTTAATRLRKGKGRRAVAQVVEYLRRRSIPLGLLSNGTQWQLIWADTDSLAWVEWESDRWLKADQLSGELAALRRVLSAAALTRSTTELSPLLTAIRDTRRGQANLSKELGERVRRAVEALLRSRESLVGPAWTEHASADLYVAACHFVMRLVVTLFAEARELLPADNPVYHHAYGLRGLLDKLDRLTAERRKARYMAWPRLLALFRLLHEGSPHPAITLPAYGGDLFRLGDAKGDGVQRALALLEALPEPPDDDVVHRILVLLTRTTQKIREGSGWRTVAALVDFTELTSEYIGILYEGLLDYELHRAGKQPVIFLNLGDQPALPLDRLEAMDNAALKALVEKAKVKKQIATEEGEDDAAEDDEPDGEQSDDSEGDESESVEGAEESDDSGLDDDVVDDARAEAHARALAWGRRAAEVGKLVKKPKGKKADVAAVYGAQLDAAAKQLVADLKLPGEIYLVRWGGTRKGAGTFYTRPQLTLPTVRRTLEPVVQEAGVVRPPEVLLALKVCDPAMGSGSFLVAALRVLTAAVIESLHTHERILKDNGRTTVDCPLLPEADRSLPTEGFDERLEAIVRRAVVEHCLYGVDIDPLAVELARVALWVETLDKRLPFTFLDHKLRCGDALVGTWLDRFRDYPLLAFDRESPDWEYKGVNYEADVWHGALKEKRAQAISEQVDILTGQLRLQGATSDEELKTAVDRVRRLYRELRAIPAGRPDERARIWRQRIQDDTALARVREAFDTWCALWFWPLDQLDVLPLPSELHTPSEAARKVVKKLRDQRRFLHWELEFPDVFTDDGAGFDSVVGNPPWEIQKPSSMEFFSNRDPLYRTYGKQEALRIQKSLFEAHPVIEAEWLAYNGGFKDRANFVKHAAEPYGDGKIANLSSGNVNLVRGKQNAALHKTWRGSRARYRGTSDIEHPFRHQGSADLNTYKMFVEVAHALLRAGGQLGLIVPGGLYSDKGTGNLRRLLLERCAWRLLYAFQNERKFFRDAHHAQKQCVFIAQKGGIAQGLETMFKLGIADSPEPEDIPFHLGVGWQPVVLRRAAIDEFSPKSLSLLEIRSKNDLTVLTKLYANGVLLGDDGPDGWGIKYAREFDMTNDSKLFVARDKAEGQGFVPDVYGRWVSDKGDVLLPLYEGRMIGQFDFSNKGWVSGKGRSAVWREIPWSDKRVEPQFLISEGVVRREWTRAWLVSEGGLSQKAAKEAALELAADRVTYAEVLAATQDRVAFMDVTAATNTRTMLAVYLRGMPCGNSAPVLTGAGVLGSISLASMLNAFCYDWIARARCGGLHLNWHVVDESAVPSIRAEALVRRIAARLQSEAASVKAALFGEKMRPFVGAVTRHERLRLRCMLDAVVAALYGLDHSDFAWILKDCDHPKADLANKGFCRQLDAKGFWRVDKTEDPELRHTVLSLAAFGDLQVAIAAANGNRDAGIQAFCDQHDGDGWMLPETLCVADIGLTRTVNASEYDDRARTQQPVRNRLGERFLEWQLAQTPEDSWSECERHAEAILAELSTPAVEISASSTTSPAKRKSTSKPTTQTSLPGVED